MPEKRKVSFKGFVDVRIYCPPSKPIYTVCNENKSPKLQIKTMKLSVDQDSYKYKSEKIEIKYKIYILRYLRFHPIFHRNRLKISYYNILNTNIFYLY